MQICTQYWNYLEELHLYSGVGHGLDKVSKTFNGSYRLGLKTSESAVKSCSTIYLILGKSFNLSLSLVFCFQKRGWWWRYPQHLPYRVGVRTACASTRNKPLAQGQPSSPSPGHDSHPWGCFRLKQCYLHISQAGDEVTGILLLFHSESCLWQITSREFVWGHWYKAETKLPTNLKQITKPKDKIFAY